MKDIQAFGTANLLPRYSRFLKKWLHSQLIGHARRLYGGLGGTHQKALMEEEKIVEGLFWW